MFPTPAKVADDFRDLRKLDTVGAAGDAGRRTMTADTPEPPPRRKWHLPGWLNVLILVFVTYLAGRLVDSMLPEDPFRSALKQAKALGWQVASPYPSDEMWEDWKGAFEEPHWEDEVWFIGIPADKSFEQHLDILHRLNPRGLGIKDAHALRDLSALTPLSRLKYLFIRNGTNLTNVDALKNLTALKEIHLLDCTALTNVDGLKALTALEVIDLSGSTGLMNVDGLKNLRTLKRLILPGCTALTNVDILTNFPTLKVLDLEGCTGLTNVDALKNLTAIETIWLFGCTGLPKEHIIALKAALPKTDIYFGY